MKRNEVRPNIHARFQAVLERALAKPLAGAPEPAAPPSIPDSGRGEARQGQARRGGAW